MPKRTFRQLAILVYLVLYTSAKLLKCVAMRLIRLSKMQNAGEQTQARLNIWPPELLHEIVFLNSSSKTVRKRQSTFLTMAEALSALTTALRSPVVSERKWATPVHLEFAATSPPVAVPLARSTRPSDEVQAPCQRDVGNSPSFSSTANES